MSVWCAVILFVEKQLSGAVINVTTSSIFDVLKNGQEVLQLLMMVKVHIFTPQPLRLWGV